MSSQDVIKTVSKKLQYYFQVKRLEDGFDLSGPYSPKLDHPPLKKRPTLLYDGLHDKPVKHYFSKHNIRQQLTHMKGVEQLFQLGPDQKPNTDREDQIRKDVDYYLASTRFVHPYLPEACYENTPRMGHRLRREMQGGFGVPLKKNKKSFKGGYPLLRSVPPHNISKGEATRLVSVATKLLCATEAVDVDMPNKKEVMNRKITSAPQTRFRSDKLPEVKSEEEYAQVETYPPNRPVSANVGGARRRGTRYTYDLHGRKVPLKQKMNKISPRMSNDNSFDDSYLARRRDDSAYVSNDNDNSADENKDKQMRNDGTPRSAAPSGQDREHIPHWLREQMQKVDSTEERKLHNNWVRPHGAPSPGARSVKSDDSDTRNTNTPMSHAPSHTSGRVAGSTRGSSIRGPGSNKAPSSVGAQSSVGAGSSIGAHPGYKASAIYGDPGYVASPPHSVGHQSNGQGSPASVSQQVTPRDEPYNGRAPTPPREPANINDFSDARSEDSYDGERVDGDEQRDYQRPWTARGQRPLHGRPKSSKWVVREDVTLSSGDEVGDQEMMTDDDIAMVEDAGVQTGRELLLQYDHSEAVVGSGQEVAYKVIVRTGTRIGASTKADISLILYGERGRSPEIPLLESKNHKVKFQKGQKDTFIVKFHHLGKLDKIKIGHHRTEIGSGWFLGSVTIKDPMLKTCYEFPCDRWLSARDKDGKGITMRELRPSTSRNATSDTDTARSGASSTISEASNKKAPDSPRGDADMSARSTTSEASTDSPTPRSSRSTARSKSPGSEKSVNTSLQGNESHRSDDERKSYVEQSQESDTATETESESESSTSRSTPRQLSDREAGAKYEVEVKDHGSDKDPGSEAEQSKEEDKDFFDSKPVEKDVSFLHAKNNQNEQSVKTDDKSDDKSDFESDKPQVSIQSASDNDNNELSDSETEGETAIIDNPEMRETKSILRAPSDSETEKSRHSDSEQEKKGAVSDSEGEGRLSESESGKKDSEYLSGFMAGVEAARKAQEEENKSDYRTDQSDSESEDRRILRGPTIHQAAKSGTLERVKALCNHNSELTNSVDEKGLTSLQIACSNGHIDIAKWLAANGAELEKETPTGYTAMHLASMNGHVNCMMVLHAMGGQITCLSVDQQTPLHLASMSGHLETVKWLVANRADLDQQDSMGRSPEELADEYEHQDVLDFLKKCADEQKNPDSSLAMMRTNTHQSASPEPNDSSLIVNDGSTQNLRKDSVGSSTWSDDKKETEVKHSSPRPGTALARKISTTSETTATGTDSETEADDTENAGTDSEQDEAVTAAELEKKKRHEDDLQEKKREFDEFEERRQSIGPGVSFLDAIRAEYGDD